MINVWPLVFHTQAGRQAYAQLQRLPLWTEKFQCIRSWVRPFASMGNLDLASARQRSIGGGFLALPPPKLHVPEIWSHLTVMTHVLPFTSVIEIWLQLEYWNRGVPPFNAKGQWQSEFNNGPNYQLPLRTQKFQYIRSCVWPFASTGKLDLAKS